jgi:2-polyprenyl-3-methyl-5-hydroxy-6-metoxy-1,4-benzoquinol methylase
MNEYWIERGKRNLLNVGFDSQIEIDRRNVIERLCYSEHLQNNFKQKKINCLDVACGLGRLTRWLSQDLKHDVTAFDLVTEYVEKTQRDSPDAKVCQSTVADFVCDEKFDVVFSSGIVMYIAIQSLFDLCKQSTKPGSLVFVRETFAIGETFKITCEKLDNYSANYKNMGEVIEVFLQHGTFELVAQKYLFDYSIPKKTHKSLVTFRRLC